MTFFKFKRELSFESFQVFYFVEGYFGIFELDFYYKPIS